MINSNAIFYLPMWYFRNRFSGRKQPLQTVLAITNRCNLRCRHCSPAAHAGTVMKPYGQIRAELQYAYRAGSRFVDFEGGEPTLWQDGGHTLNDLYDLAKSIGFFSGTLTTNGQNPFGGTHADFVWVSVDGVGPVHDRIRGDGTFERLDRNLRTCGLPHVGLNMVINRLNRDAVSETVLYARENPAVQSISLNFQTPFPGTEELMLPRREKNEVIGEILRLKQEGYPILNSVSGLRAMQRNDFERVCWITNFILPDGTILPECPGRKQGICGDCGFCMAGEMWAVMHLKPDTIRNGLQLRLK